MRWFILFCLIDICFSLSYVNKPILGRQKSLKSLGLTKYKLNWDFDEKVDLDAYIGDTDDMWTQYVPKYGLKTEDFGKRLTKKECKNFVKQYVKKLCKNLKIVHIIPPKITTKTVCPKVSDFFEDGGDISSSDDHTCRLLTWYRYSSWDTEYWLEEWREKFHYDWFYWTKPVVVGWIPVGSKYSAYTHSRITKRDDYEVSPWGPTILWSGTPPIADVCIFGDGKVEPRRCYCGGEILELGKSLACVNNKIRLPSCNKIIGEMLPCIMPDGEECDGFADLYQGNITCFSNCNLLQEPVSEICPCNGKVCSIGDKCLTGFDNVQGTYPIKCESVNCSLDTDFSLPCNCNGERIESGVCQLNFVSNYTMCIENVPLNEACTCSETQDCSETQTCREGTCYDACPEGQVSSRCSCGVNANDTQVDEYCHEGEISSPYPVCHFDVVLDSTCLCSMPRIGLVAGDAEPGQMCVRESLGFMSLRPKIISLCENNNNVTKNVESCICDSKETSNSYCINDKIIYDCTVDEIHSSESNCVCSSGIECEPGDMCQSDGICMKECSVNSIVIESKTCSCINELCSSGDQCRDPIPADSHCIPNCPNRDGTASFSGVCGCGMYNTNDTHYYCYDYDFLPTFTSEYYACDRYSIVQEGHTCGCSLNNDCDIDTICGGPFKRTQGECTSFNSSLYLLTYQQVLLKQMTVEECEYYGLFSSHTWGGVQNVASNPSACYLQTDTVYYNQHMNDIAYDSNKISVIFQDHVQLPVADECSTTDGSLPVRRDCSCGDTIAPAGTFCHSDFWSFYKQCTLNILTPELCTCSNGEDCDVTDTCRDDGICVPKCSINEEIFSRCVCNGVDIFSGYCHDTYSSLNPKCIENNITWGYCYNEALGFSTKEGCLNQGVWTSECTPDKIYTTEKSCETVGDYITYEAYCNNTKFETQDECETSGSFLAYCSDGQYNASEELCVHEPGVWKLGCKNSAYSNEESCETQGVWVPDISGETCHNDYIFTDEVSCNNQGFWSDGPCSVGEFSNKDSCETVGIWKGCVNQAFISEIACTTKGSWTSGSGFCERWIQTDGLWDFKVDNTYTNQIDCENRGTWKHGECRYEEGGDIVKECRMTPFWFRFDRTFTTEDACTKTGVQYIDGVCKTFDGIILEGGREIDKDHCFAPSGLWKRKFEYPHLVCDYFYDATTVCLDVNDESVLSGIRSTSQELCESRIGIWTSTECKDENGFSLNDGREQNQESCEAPVSTFNLCTDSSNKQLLGGRQVSEEVCESDAGIWGSCSRCDGCTISEFYDDLTLTSKVSCETKGTWIPTICQTSSQSLLSLTAELCSTLNGQYISSSCKSASGVNLINGRDIDKYHCEAPSGIWGKQACQSNQTVCTAASCNLPEWDHDNTIGYPQNEYQCTNRGTWEQAFWADVIVSQTCKENYFTDESTCELGGKWIGKCVSDIYTSPIQCTLRDETITYTPFPAAFKIETHGTYSYDYNTNAFTHVLTIEQCHIRYTQQRDKYGKDYQFIVNEDGFGCREFSEEKQVIWGGGLNIDCSIQNPCVLMKAHIKDDTFYDWEPTWNSNQCEVHYSVDEGAIQCKSPYTDHTSCTNKGEWHNTCIAPFYTEGACTAKFTTYSSLRVVPVVYGTPGSGDKHWNDDTLILSEEQCEGYAAVLRYDYELIDDTTKTIGCTQTVIPNKDRGVKSKLTFNKASSCDGEDCSCEKGGFICYRLASNWQDYYDPDFDTLYFSWQDGKCMYTQNYTGGSQVYTSTSELLDVHDKLYSRLGVSRCETKLGYRSHRIMSRHESESACEAPVGNWNGERCEYPDIVQSECNGIYEWDGVCVGPFLSEISCITTGSWYEEPPSKERCEAPPGIWDNDEKRCEYRDVRLPETCTIGFWRGECYDFGAQLEADFNVIGPRLQTGGRELSERFCEMSEDLAWLKEKNTCYHHNVPTKTECKSLPSDAAILVGNTIHFEGGREINQAACEADSGVWEEDRCEFQHLSNSSTVERVWDSVCKQNIQGVWKEVDISENLCTNPLEIIKANQEVDWTSVQQSCLNMGHQTQFIEDCYEPIRRSGRQYNIDGNYKYNGNLISSSLRRSSRKYCELPDLEWTDQPQRQPYPYNEIGCYYKEDQVNKKSECSIVEGVWNDEENGAYDPQEPGYRFHIMSCYDAVIRTGRCIKDNEDITYHDLSKNLYHRYDCEYAGGEFVTNDWGGPDISVHGSGYLIDEAALNALEPDMSKPNMCYVEDGLGYFNPTFSSHIRCSIDHVCLKEYYKGICMSEYNRWITGLRATSQAACEAPIGEWVPETCKTYSGNINREDLSGGRETNQETCESPRGVWESGACTNFLYQNKEECDVEGKLEETCKIDITTQQDCETSGIWKEEECILPYTTKESCELISQVNPNSDSYQASICDGVEGWFLINMRWFSGENVCRADFVKNSTTTGINIRFPTDCGFGIHGYMEGGRIGGTATNCLAPPGVWDETNSRCVFPDGYSNKLSCDRVGGKMGECWKGDLFLKNGREIDKSYCETPTEWIVDTFGDGSVHDEYCSLSFITSERGCHTKGVWENNKCNIGEGRSGSVGDLGTKEMCEAPIGTWHEKCVNPDCDITSNWQTQCILPYMPEPIDCVQNDWSEDCIVLDIEEIQCRRYKPGVWESYQYIISHSKDYCRKQGGVPEDRVDTGHVCKVETGGIYKEECVQTDNFLRRTSKFTAPEYQRQSKEHCEAVFKYDFNDNVCRLMGYSENMCKSSAIDTKWGRCLNISKKTVDSEIRNTNKTMCELPTSWVGVCTIDVDQTECESNPLQIWEARCNSNNDGSLARFEDQKCVGYRYTTREACETQGHWVQTSSVQYQCQDDDGNIAPTERSQNVYYGMGMQGLCDSPAGVWLDGYCIINANCSTLDSYVYRLETIEQRKSVCEFKGDWNKPRCMSGSSILKGGREVDKSSCEAPASNYNYCSVSERGRDANQEACEEESKTKWIKTCTADGVDLGGVRTLNKETCEAQGKWYDMVQQCESGNDILEDGRDNSQLACEAPAGQYGYCNLSGERSVEDKCESLPSTWGTCSCSENNECSEGKVCTNGICNDPPACQNDVELDTYCTCSGIAKPSQFCHGYISNYAKCVDSQKTFSSCSCADGVDCNAEQTCISGVCHDACPIDEEIQTECACGNNGIFASVGQYCYDSYISDYKKCLLGKTSYECECGDHRGLIQPNEYCHGTYDSLFPLCTDSGKKCHCTETTICPTGYVCESGSCILPPDCVQSEWMVDHLWERDFSYVYKSKNKYCMCDNKLLPPGEFCYGEYSSVHLACSVYRNDVRVYDSCRETYLTTEECNAQNKNIQLDYRDYERWWMNVIDEHWRKERCPDTCLDTETAIGETCFPLGGTQGDNYECTNVGIESSWDFGYKASSSQSSHHGVAPETTTLNCGTISMGNCSNVSPPPAFDIDGCEHEKFQDNLYVNDFNFINPYDLAMSAGGAKPFGFRLKLENLASDNDIVTKLESGTVNITRNGVQVSDYQKEIKLINRKGYTDFLFEKPIVIGWSNDRLENSIVDKPSKLEPMPFQRDFTMNEIWEKSVENSSAIIHGNFYVKEAVAAQGQLEKLTETPTGKSSASFVHGVLEGCISDNPNVTVRRIAYKSANKALLIDLKGTLKTGQSLMLKCYMPNRFKKLPLSGTYHMNYNYGLMKMPDFDLKYDYSFFGIRVHNLKSVTNTKLNFAPVQCEKSHSSYTLYGYSIITENDWSSDSLDISVKCATSMGYHGKTTWDGSGDNVEVYSCAGDLNEKLVDSLDWGMFQGFHDSLPINPLLGVVPVGCEIGRAVAPSIIPRGYKLDTDCDIFTSEKGDCCGCTKFSSKNQFSYRPTLPNSVSNPNLIKFGYCPPKDSYRMYSKDYGKPPVGDSASCQTQHVVSTERLEYDIDTVETNNLKGCFQHTDGVFYNSGEGLSETTEKYQCIEKRDGIFKVGSQCDIISQEDCFTYFRIKNNSEYLHLSDPTLLGGCQKYDKTVLFNDASNIFECSEDVPCIVHGDKYSLGVRSIEECDSLCADYGYSYFSYGARCICTVSHDKSNCPDWNMTLDTYKVTIKSNTYFNFQDDSCRLNSLNFCADNWHSDFDLVQCPDEKSWFSDNNFVWSGIYQPTFTSWTQESLMKHVYIEFTEETFQPNEVVSWGEYNFQGCIPPQVWELKQGWNWVSVGVILKNPSVSSLQGFSVGDRIVCQGTRGEATYYESHGWAGSLSELKVFEMCKIYVQTDKTIEIYGYVPSSPEIHFKRGWNWIGFPTNETMTLNDIPINELQMQFNKNSYEINSGVTGGDRIVCEDWDTALQYHFTYEHWYDHSHGYIANNPSNLVIKRNRGCKIFKENLETQPLGGMANFGKTWI